MTRPIAQHVKDQPAATVRCLVCGGLYNAAPTPSLAVACMYDVRLAVRPSVWGACGTLGAVVCDIG